MTFSHIIEFHCSTSETVAQLQNKPLVYPDTIFKFTKRYRQDRAQGVYLKDFHQRIIEERREILKTNDNNNITNNNNEEKDQNGYSIFIDHILKNEGMFTDDDIKDHVITVLSAGETLMTLNSACIFVALADEWLSH